MQLTIKLKGFLKIAFFFAVTAASASYFLYKTARYFAHWQRADKKAASNLKFVYTFETHDTLKKGFILLAPIVQNHLRFSNLIIMDLSGHIVFEKQVAGNVLDFRQWKTGGATRYSYSTIDSVTYAMLGTRASASCIVLLDSTLNELKRIHLQATKDIIVSKKQDLDPHDFILLANDHYITLAGYGKTVGNIPAYLFPATRNRISVPIIQEVRGDNVVWQWDASDFPEFYSSSTKENDFYDSTKIHSYVHVNSMIIDPRDSNLILSLRNCNQIIKISRSTGKIMWRLGGKNSDFQLAAKQVFLQQHHVTLADDNQTLLVFDNGDKQIRPYSRILEFKLNEIEQTITSFSAFNIPEPFSEAKGSVQKEGDDYYICGGNSGYVLKVNRITGTKKTELKGNQCLYRAYWVKDIPGLAPGNK